MAKRKQTETAQLTLPEAASSQIERGPLLADSLKRLLADPLTFAGQTVSEWTPPQVSPPVESVDDAIAKLELFMSPCSKLDCIACLMAMANVLKFELGEEPSTEDEWMARGELYHHTIGHLPIDILEAATFELIRGGDWFPNPHRILQIAEPQYGLRQRMLQRARLLADHIRGKVVRAGHNRSSSSYPDVSNESVADRLTNMCASYRRRIESGQWLIVGKQRTINRYNIAERELAALQGRSPFEFPDDYQPAAAPAPEAF